MFKYFPLLLIFLWPISAEGARILISDGLEAELPDSCVAGTKTQITIKGAAPLPASSFYRVDINCPVKPAKGAISMQTGYPVSDITFSEPGLYECGLEIGILTKSSCAGVQYRELGRSEFKVTVQ